MFKSFSKGIAAITVGSSLMLSAGIQANEDMEDRIVNCFQMKDEAERISCYDKMARQQIKDNPEKAAVVKQRAIDDFGIKHQEQTYDELYMTVVSVTRNGTDMIMTMDNGQVWEKTSEEDYRFHEDPPKVKVFQLWLGSYAMKEEGRAKKMRVQRVK
jgi:hypothetical protein